MAEIIWETWQDEHITERHEVSRQEFAEAWGDRLIDLDRRGAHKAGPYWVSVGFTHSGRLLTMVWRWQVEDVWPITAYPRRERRRRS